MGKSMHRSIIAAAALAGVLPAPALAQDKPSDNPLHAALGAPHNTDYGYFDLTFTF